MSALPARILVVDDARDTCDLMRRLLQKQGYQVHTATTCHEATELGRRVPFDLLIADLLIGDGDGLHVLQELRKLYPVEGILITGVDRAYSDLVTDLEAAHFAIRLTKPIDIAHLLEVIETLLDPLRRKALGIRSVDAARAALRARALGEKIQTMTDEQVRALSRAMQRHGEDLSEEMDVLVAALQKRCDSIAQRYPPQG